MAQLTGISEVTLGYERSADEGNKIYVQVPVSHSNTDQNKQIGQVPTMGEVVLEEVNHQYDKSSTFLAQAQAYINTSISCDVRVVSTLHGLWEIQVFLPLFFGCILILNVCGVKPPSLHLDTVLNLIPLCVCSPFFTQTDLQVILRGAHFAGFSAHVPLLQRAHCDVRLVQALRQMRVYLSLALGTPPSFTSGQYSVWWGKYA